MLRAEMTISVTRYFRVYRRTDDPHLVLAWRPMRQSTADLHQRATISQQTLDRYGCALAAVDDSSTLEELIAVLERRVRWKGQPVRALHPFDKEDHALFEAVLRGDLNLTGFRNKDLHSLLYSTAPKKSAEQRRRSALISRKLRLLRAHGLIRKRSHSYRYDVIRQGRLVLSAILSAHRLTTQQITSLAA